MHRRHSGGQRQRGDAERVEVGVDEQWLEAELARRCRLARPGRRVQLGGRHPLVLVGRALTALTRRGARRSGGSGRQGAEGALGVSVFFFLNFSFSLDTAVKEENARRVAAMQAPEVPEKVLVRSRYEERKSAPQAKRFFGGRAVHSLVIEKEIRPMALCAGL